MFNLEEIVMLHDKDVKNFRKHAKMERRHERGVLPVGSHNSGDSNRSKIHPGCKWYRRRGGRDD